MTKARVSLLLLLSLVAAVTAQSARADAPDDVARARVLFFEARTMMAEGRWAEACPRLEESERLDAGMGTEFNLADCHEHTGRLASALQHFEHVVAVSHDAGQDRHEAVARQRVEALLLRVPTVTIDVPPSARVPELAITRDGEPVSSAAWQRPLTLDPGHHVIAASAPGREPWTHPIDLVEGEHAALVMPDLALSSPPPAIETRPVAPAREEASPRPADEGAGRRTLGLALGGVGAAALITGGVFGGLSMAARDDARHACDAITNACSTQAGVDARASAVARGDASTAFLIAGGVALSAGIVVWLTAPRAAGVRAGLQATAGGHPRFSLSGEF